MHNVPGEVPSLSAAASPRPRWRTAAALIALCLLVYLSGFFAIPPVDRDESRFAQASRQMFESVALPVDQRDPRLHAGGLVIPMVQDRPRLNKPPLIYWLQAGSAAIFTGGDPLRDAIWMYRVPSLLAAIAAILMTWRLGASMFGEAAGVLAAAMLAVCPIIAWEAHQARADMVLLACTTASLWAMWSIFRRGPRLPPSRFLIVIPLFFWLSLAAGILTKGPITPMVAGLAALTISIVSRRWRWLLGLRPVPGLLLLIACVVPWVYAVGQKTGWETYLKTIADETLGRSVSAKEGHWGPPGYHLVLLPVLFWPGSLLTAAGIIAAFRQVRRQRRKRKAAEKHKENRQAAESQDAKHVTPHDRTPDPSLPSRLVTLSPCPALFCLAWILPVWVVFELVGTKLPHYTMPLYPAIAILSARAVVLASGGVLPLPQGRGLALAKWPWVFIGAALCIAAPLAPWFLGVRHSLWLVPLLLLWGGAVAYWLRHALPPWNTTQGWTGRQLAGLVAITAALALLLQGLLPQTKRLWLSNLTLDVVRSVDPQFRRPLAAMGYHEDSLVFLTRAGVELIDEAEAGAWWRAHPDGLMILPTARVLRIHTPVGNTAGFNYSKGRFEELSVVGLFRPQ